MLAARNFETHLKLAAHRQWLIKQLFLAEAFFNLETIIIVEKIAKKIYAVHIP